MPVRILLVVTVPTFAVSSASVNPAVRRGWRQLGSRPYSWQAGILLAVLGSVATTELVKRWIDHSASGSRMLSLRLGGAARWHTMVNP